MLWRSKQNQRLTPRIHKFAICSVLHLPLLSDKFPSPENLLRYERDWLKISPQTASSVPDRHTQPRMWYFKKMILSLRHTLTHTRHTHTHTTYYTPHTYTPHTHIHTTPHIPHIHTHYTHTPHHIYTHTTHIHTHTTYTYTHTHYTTQTCTHTTHTYTHTHKGFRVQLDKEQCSLCHRTLGSWDNQHLDFDDPADR